MKKLIPIILSLTLLFSFTGCNAQNKYVKAAGKYGYMSVFNTSWGMSIDECIKTLRLDKDSVKIEQYTDDNGLEVMRYFVIDETFYGEKAQVSFIFGNWMNEEVDKRLLRVGVKFDTPIERDFADSKTTEFLEKQNIEYSVGGHQMYCWYNNKATLDTIQDDTLKEKVIAFSKDLYPDEEKYYDGYLRKPLDTVRLHYSGEKTTIENPTISEMYFEANGAMRLSYCLFKE